MSANIRLLKDNNRTIIVIDGQDVAITDAVNAFVAMFLNGQLDKQSQKNVDNGNLAASVSKTDVVAANNEPTADNVSDDDNNVTTMSNVANLIPARDTVPGLEPAAIVSIDVPTDDEMDRMEAVASGQAVEPVKMSGGDYAGKTCLEALGKDGIKALARMFQYAKTLKNGEERDTVVSVCKAYLSGNFMFEVSNCTTRFDKTKFLDTVADITPIDEISHGLGMLKYKDFKTLASDDDVDQLFKAVSSSLMKRGA